MYTPKCIKTKTQNLCLTPSPVDGLGLFQTLCCSTGKHGVVVVVVVVVVVANVFVVVFCTKRVDTGHVNIGEEL